MCGGDAISRPNTAGPARLRPVRQTGYNGVTSGPPAPDEQDSMRKLCFVLGVLLLPLPAAAQQSFSLPPIGLPLPSIGLGPVRQAVPWEPTPTPAWEKRPLPDWERNRLPPWETGHQARRIAGGEHQKHVIGPQVIYYLPYPVAVVAQPPQVIVVQPPAVTHVVTVEMAPREPREEPPPAPSAPAPPLVPAGDRTVYVIPGCYVGNVPPANLKLPAHCDVKKVTTFTP